MDYYLKCLNCGAEYSKNYDKQICEKCDGILEVIYKENRVDINYKGFWSFEKLMPNGNYKKLEVGNTRIIEDHKNKDLFLKLEIDNPTNSFKDRGSVIEVAKAKEYGFDTIVCASTGNMAYSLSYISKIYSMNIVVFISKDANKDKIRDIERVGDAKVIRVNGDFTKAQELALRYAKRRNLFLAGDYCYRKAAQSTMAFEIMYQIGKIDNIIVPVGNATLISAIYKAYKRAYKMGIIDYMPRIFGVEARACNPLYYAIKKGNIKYIKPNTKADAIAVGYPTYWKEGVEAIKESKGDILLVSDKEMKYKQEYLYKEFGLIAELAGVASLAAFDKVKLKGKTIAIISGGNE